MQLFANNARATLTALASTSLTVSDGSQFPVANRGTSEDGKTNTWFKLVLKRGTAFEICYVHTHAGGGVMTNVLRAQDGTTQTAWPLGETDVYCAPLASDSAKFEALRFVENGIPYVSYDARADLRSQEKGVRMVESLGLFLWFADSDEPDDDESCFATASGAWLLECPSWDVVNDWQLPDDDVRDERLEDAEDRLSATESALASKMNSSRVLTGNVTSSITSVAATAQVSFTASINGASAGDVVIATPPGALGPRLSCFAAVTAANTVTIYLNNPSASAQSISTGVWSLAVITKQ